MRIGLINELHGRPGGPTPAPTWDSILERATTAEEVGFDSFVFEDALLYRWPDGNTDGVWESGSIAAGLAATTSRIVIAHSVLNSPYRAPALTASMATTLDEISAGRYVLGIGAGNTFDSDYEAFGFPTDSRYSRFAEAIQIVHGLLKTGHVNFDGEFYSVKDSELVLRGPSPTGPPINIAAGGPKMLGLVARYADQWNWWAYDESVDQIQVRFEPILETLGLALEESDRDAASLVRTVDLYSIVPPTIDADHELANPVKGSANQVAEFILRLEEMGFAEVRCDLLPKTVDAIEAMAPVVELVHG